MTLRRLLWFVTLLGLVLGLACRERATVTRGPRARERPATTSTASARERDQGPVMKPEPRSALPEGVQPMDATSLRTRLRLDSEARPEARGTLLNLWASWCGSCKREIPMLLELSKLFGPQGIDFAFLSADEPASFAAAREKMERWGVAAPTLVIAKGALGPVKELLHPTWDGALPASFLFDAAGRRRYFWEGPMQEHELVPILQAFVAGTLQDGEHRPPLSAGKVAE